MEPISPLKRRRIVPNSRGATRTAPTVTPLIYSRHFTIPILVGLRWLERVRTDGIKSNGRPTLIFILISDVMNDARKSMGGNRMCSKDKTDLTSLPHTGMLTKPYFWTTQKVGRLKMRVILAIHWETFSTTKCRKCTSNGVPQPENRYKTQTFKNDNSAPPTKLEDKQQSQTHWCCFSGISLVRGNGQSPDSEFDCQCSSHEMAFKPGMAFYNKLSLVVCLYNEFIEECPPEIHAAELLEKSSWCKSCRNIRWIQFSVTSGIALCLFPTGHCRVLRRWGEKSLFLLIVAERTTFETLSLLIYICFKFHFGSSVVSHS